MIRSRTVNHGKDGPTNVTETAATSVEVVQELLTLIRVEGLASGDRLPSIRQLAVRLGVRPHTVRDALLQAQTLGHIKVRPRSRAVVQSQPVGNQLPGAKSKALETATVGTHETDGHHFFHLLEARQLIELETVRQAAQRRRLEDLLPVRVELDAMNAIHKPERRQEFVEHDLRFHLAIARVGGNPVVTAMLRPLLASLEPLFCREPFVASVVDRVRRSHTEIYRALVSGEADVAQERMRDHLRLAYDYLLREMQTLPD